MTKLLSFLQSNIFSALTVLVVVALLISNNQLRSQSQQFNGGNLVKSETSEATELPNSPDFNPTPPYDPALLPHANCISQLYYSAPISDVYVSDVPYNVTFAKGNPTNYIFQDINGDNLPDFLYSHNSNSGGNNEIYTDSQACVYLNNGSGWDKVYTCYATTGFNPNTREFILKQYRGDCAGTPSSQSEE